MSKTLPSNLPRSGSVRDDSWSSIDCIRTAWLVVAVYVIVSALWIGLSDQALSALVTDRILLAEVQTLKGWVFVAVTGAGLFWVLRAKLEQQREGERKLTSFVEHAPVALAMLDRDLRYIITSSRWKKDFNLESRDLVGALHYEIFPNLPESWRAVNKRALNGETVTDNLTSLTCDDGRVVWMRREVRPWLNAAGAIGGIVIFAEDVTDRKNAEIALAESQGRLELALGAGGVSTWSWDLAESRIDYDDGVQRLIGYSRQELAQGGMQFFRSIVHPDDRTQFDAVIAATTTAVSEVSTEYRIVRPDGACVWISSRGTVERDASGVPVRLTGVSVDVTESHRMQKALQESENRFREVVESIDEVFWISDVAKNQIFYVSPAYERIWGHPCRELCAGGLTWLDAVHTDDRERVLQAALKKQALGTYDETYRIVRPDGGIRWVRDLAFPVRDVQGALLRIVGCARDITEQKNLEDQFLRAQRLEAIGTLASGVAHDLNNILAPMFMIGPLLREKLSDQSDAELLTILESSAQRGANVVRQLLTFSRGIAGERGPLQVRHLVKEMSAIMHETFPREIGIVHQIPADLWPVVGDATQLHQVLMNLCVNARDAMASGGRLSIDAKNTELSAADLMAQPGAKPGHYVVITVSDTGHGISEANKARIFEPFFTTKEIGKGTGLGLSTVLGIVKSHGGFVTLESQLGVGTKFHVHLPSAESTAEFPLAAAQPSEAAPGRGELVLIVDDEANVRLAMQRILEHNGYAVLTAANGREGLGLYLLQREKVRVVVTDLMMPEMGGVALVRAIRDLHADLPILAATGLIREERRNELLALGVNELLPKPYSSFELIDAVGRALQVTKAGTEETCKRPAA